MKVLASYVDLNGIRNLKNPQNNCTLPIGDYSLKSSLFTHEGNVIQFNTSTLDITFGVIVVTFLVTLLMNKFTIIVIPTYF